MSDTPASPVKLIATTQGAGDLINKNAQEVISFITRVSNPNNQMNFETSPKLLAYCIRNGHWSPFEHAFLTLEIETTRAIAAQILRHRSFCLSGDTLLTFELPGALKKGKRAVYKRALKTLHDQFNEGARPIPRRPLTWDFSRIEDGREYSPSELAELLGIAAENLRTYCAKGRLRHRKADGRILIKGADVLAYHEINLAGRFRSPLKDRIQKMHLRNYNEVTRQFETTRIKNIWSTGVRSVFKLTTANGYSVRCTDDHPLLTSDGSYQTLAKGLGVQVTRTGTATFDSSRSMVLATNGIPVYQSADWLRSMKELGRDVTAMADEAGCSYHTIRAWLKRHRLQFTRAETARLHPIWNRGRSGYTVAPRTDAQRALMRAITPRGPDHHAYRGGGSAARKAIANAFNPFRKEIYAKYGFTCQLCEKPFGSDRIELHHIKEVSSHPDLALEISNVIPVHRRCHLQHHGKTSDYVAWRSTHKGNSLTVAWSPIVAVEYVGEETVYDVEVEGPFHNFVADGVVVHNCFQEFSQRYAKAAEYEETRARRQDAKNRQNSTDDLTDSEQGWFQDAQKKIWDLTYGLYTEALEKGIAKECARFLLPLNTKTRIYMSGNARSWIHYIELRAAHGTQKEHMDIAVACRKIFIEQFPDIARGLEWPGA